MLKPNCQVTGLLGILLISACSSTPPVSGTSPVANAGRYEMKNDSPVLETFDPAKVVPVIPKPENRTLAGNKSPYTVNGTSYRVLTTEAGYSEYGMASWYGRKFHGHLTSNGEIYDMFQLSAAHTQLPIPSYARVTNLDNGKNIIVRVNDRGPFHTGRIIDLSYAAAVMLDYADKGTARVRVEAIVPEQSARPGGQVVQSEPLTVTPLPEPEQAPTAQALADEKQRIDAGEGNEFLQVGAFANIESAQNLVSRLSKMTSMGVFIQTDTVASGATLHKVRVGPLTSELLANQLVENVKSARLGNPFRVRI